MSDCTAYIDIHGYSPAECQSEAVDACRECLAPLCQQHIDCLGRCAMCAEMEDHPIDISEYVTVMEQETAS
jgi:hypothetical protein